MADTERTTHSPLKYSDAIKVQMGTRPMKNEGRGWVSASESDVDRYMNPENFKTGDAKFQHLDLSAVPDVTASQLNNFLRGKGVLEGMGSAFLEAGRVEGINPIYLVVHANLETGGGTSALARGTVPGYGGYHNLFGINAVDGTAEESGARFAKSQGWSSIEAAILGGAKFVAVEYIKRGQNTLYKMRWNPEAPGQHQYATDIGWAVKQSGPISTVYRQYFPNVSKIFDIPVYDGQGQYIGGSDPLGPKIVEFAKTLLGVPYVFGGDGPNGFDCSGFTRYVYKHVANIDLPRTAVQQYEKGTPVSIQDLRAGDLVFWSNTYKPGISHVAIAMGDGKFIGAQGDKVSIEELSNSYWKSHYTGAKRILSNADTVPGGGGIPGYNQVVNDDTPTGLAGGLPLSQINSYQQELQSALNRIRSEGINEGIIIDLSNGGSLRFHLPDDITDSTPISWEDIAILGRSVPVKGYENSGPRTIGFELHFFAGEGDHSTGNDPVDRMQADVAFLQSLVYPDYSKSFVLPPPNVLLSLGGILKLKCVCTGAEVTWKKPYTADGRPMQAQVQMTFQAVSDFPPDFYSVRYRTDKSIG